MDSDVFWLRKYTEALQLVKLLLQNVELILVVQRKPSLPLRRLNRTHIHNRLNSTIPPIIFRELRIESVGVTLNYAFQPLFEVRRGDVIWIDGYGAVGKRIVCRW